MSAEYTSLANHLLIALPGMDDPTFSRTVSLICQHTVDGSMGIVVNRPSEYTLGDLFQQMSITSQNEALCAQPVLAGGPVHAERGFVLHDGSRKWDSSLQIAEDLFITTSRDVLEAIASDEGPLRVLVALGCVGWSSGQLEQELTENCWLTVPSNLSIVFSAPLETRWNTAAGLLGIDMAHVSNYMGHA